MRKSFQRAQEEEDKAGAEHFLHVLSPPCSGLLPRLPQANTRSARGEQRGSNVPCSATQRSGCFLE